MVMSDFWSLCIIFSIEVYNLIFKYDYNSLIGNNLTPFIINNNKINFREELTILFKTYLQYDNIFFEEIRKNLLFILNNILEYSNKLIKYSKLNNNGRYCLEMTYDNMVYLYKESKNTIYNLYKQIDNYKVEFTKSIIEK